MINTLMAYIVAGVGFAIGVIIVVLIVDFLNWVMR